MPNVDVNKYRALCEEIMRKNGLRPAVAAAVADCMVMTDRFGVWSHGTANLAKYMKKVAAGGFRADADPEKTDEGPTWLRLDGKEGLGMYNGRVAMDMAIEKAKNAGMAFVTVKNSGHFGACSAYTVYAAEKGYMAVAMSNTNKLMCVPGGKGSIIGNSPVSYAIPRKSGHPVFMDIALSQAAKLKVLDLRKKGLEVPPGWVVDKDGLPTTTPEGNDFSLCPMAAHKGYCLSFFVEYLTAVLSGGALSPGSWLFGPEDQSPRVSHAFFVMDVKRIAGEEAFERFETYTDSIVSSPKAAGSDKIYYPGEINWISFDKTGKEGLPLPAATEAAVREAAEAVGLSLDGCYC